MAVQLRAPLPPNRQVSLLRIRELQADIESQEKRQLTFVETGYKRIPELRGKFTFDSNDELHQLRFRTEISDAEKRFAAMVGELSEAADAVEQGFTALIEEGNQPLELVVTVDSDGKPVRVQRALSGAA